MFHIFCPPGRSSSLSLSQKTSRAYNSHEPSELHVRTSQQLNSPHVRTSQQLNDGLSDSHVRTSQPLRLQNTSAPLGQPGLVRAPSLGGCTRTTCTEAEEGTWPAWASTLPCDNSSFPLHPPGWRPSEFLLCPLDSGKLEGQMDGLPLGFDSDSHQIFHGLIGFMMPDKTLMRP